MRSDKSIRNICIAAIKRHTIAPFDFLITRFFENELWDKLDERIGDLSKSTEGELPISVAFIDINNFTVVTTRQIITSQNGITKSVRPNDIISWTWNDFKGYSDNHFTRCQLTIIGNQVSEVFIETGKGSMVMIYAIQTLVGQYR